MHPALRPLWRRHFRSSFCCLFLPCIICVPIVVLLQRDGSKRVLLSYFPFLFSSSLLLLFYFSISVFLFSLPVALYISVGLSSLPFAFLPSILRLFLLSIVECGCLPTRRPLSSSSSSAIHIVQYS